MRGVLVLVTILLAGAASAQSPDISARRLLSAWKGEDANMGMVAEMIASAFASGFARASGGGCPKERGGQLKVVFDA